jgi:hypothetical protein
MKEIRENRIRRQINDMVTRNGKISNTKTWAFIGCSVATWIIIYMTLKDKMTWELYAAYLGTICGFSQVSRWITARFGENVSSTANTKCEDCPTSTKKKEDEGSD